MRLRRHLVVLLPLTLLLAGCGGKLSASESASELYRVSGHHRGDGFTVQCKPGSNGEDYVCTFFLRRKAFHTVGIRVNAHHITFISG